MTNKNQDTCLENWLFQIVIINHLPRISKFLSDRKRKIVHTISKEGTSQETFVLFYIALWFYCTFGKEGFFFEKLVDKTQMCNTLEATRHHSLKKYWSFYPSDPFTLDCSIMRHPVLLLKGLISSEKYWYYHFHCTKNVLLSILNSNFVIWFFPPSESADSKHNTISKSLIQDT